MRQLRGMAGQRVLIVEDESRLREMLAQGTKVMGLEPTAVGSAEQALRVLESKPCPVVVVDLNLPGVGGMELLQTIRQRWPSIQAIILTGFGDLDSARQAIHLDVVDFLTKPCALGDLEIALGRAFRRVHDAQPAIREMISDENFDPRGGEHPARLTSAMETSEQTLAFAPRDSSLALSIEEVERRAILTVLQKHGGNRAATAAELGISVRKLYYRLGEYQKKGLIS